MPSIVQLTPDIVKSDIQSLYNGTCSYVAYKPKGKYRGLLGDKVYIVANKGRQNYFSRQGYLALTLDDLKEQIGLKKIIKVMFDGKEIENGMGL